jgi:hypothetical protein
MIKGVEMERVVITLSAFLNPPSMIRSICFPLSGTEEEEGREDNWSTLGWSMLDWLMADWSSEDILLAAWERRCKRVKEEMGHHTMQAESSL